jgi:hypothetical protein
MPRFPVLGDVLQDLPDLAALVEQARRLEAWDRRLRAILPPRLANECRLANVRKRQLVFLAQSPAWASKLRLLSRQLLDEANNLGLEVQRLTVKVARPDA